MASERPVSCARLCEAGEGKEELAVFSAAAKAGDGADPREGYVPLLAACGQAVDLQLGGHICHIAHQQHIALHHTYCV